MTDLRVVPIPTGDINDIPARLEGFAASIRSGEHGEIQSGAAVFLGEDGVPIVCGWGKTGDIHSIGLLQLGVAWLSNNRVKR